MNDETKAGLDLSAATRQEQVKMIAPEDCTGISVRGMQFDVPENGEVLAPADIAAELVSHGFTVAKAAAAKTPAPRKRVS